MSVLCETLPVLEMVRYNMEVFSDSGKDAVAERILGDREDGPLIASRSLEKDSQLQAAAKKPATAAATPKGAQTKGEKDTSPAAAASPRVATAGSASAGELSFKKLLPPDVVASRNSNLSVLIARLPKPPKKVTITIYLSYGKPLKLTVPENSIVIGVIQEAIKQHGEEYRNPPLRKNPSAYELFVAEDDGTLDEIFPALSSTSSIQKFGKNFALQEKKGADEGERPEVSAKKATISGAVGPAASSSGALANSGAAGSSSGSNLKRRQTQSGKRLFKVVLPNEQKTLIPYNPEMKISELLVRVCQRRGIEPADYFFTEVDDDLQLGDSMTLSNLNGEAMLRCKNPAPVVDPVKLAFQSWIVSKTHRFGGNSVTLSIDKDRVYVEKKRKGSKQASFSMSDIAGAAVSEKHPAQFNILFHSGKSSAYSASSEDTAREIVEKITFILKNT